MAKLNEFNLIKQHLVNIGGDSNSVNSFYFFAISLIFGLSETEIDDAITDTKYLRDMGEKSGHDRGIDAVYIREGNSSSEVHLFNFKYTTKFEKLNNYFPSSEIDKLVGFVSSLGNKDQELLRSINPVLKAKVEQIWGIFEKHNPKITIHFCSNGYEEMESAENRRLKLALKDYGINIQYNLMSDYIHLLNTNDHAPVNAKIKAVGKNYFEKSDGNVRALVAEFEARDLVRIVASDEVYRDDPNLNDYNVLCGLPINDTCFKDNVRIYLRQRSKINKSIKSTLLSEDNDKIFFFNNGITITCDRYVHPGTNRNAPIIEISDLQIVNGCQTINALYEAFMEDPTRFEDVTILCRIYETDDVGLSTRISEYTNSQNPVKSRDIRSIDDVQCLLEKQLALKEIFYERKKNQYLDKPKENRIDSEVLGQALCSFYNDMPVEAKNKKNTIFGDNYEVIFHDGLDSDKVLLAWKVFQFVEWKKKEARKSITDTDEEISSYVLYASMYILFVMRHLAEINGVDITFNNIDEIKGFYDRACNEILSVIMTDEDESDGITAKNFFKSNRLKMKLQEKFGLEVL
jgi:hypothetical protein